MVLRHVVGSGAIESRSYGCVTLHAVGSGARSRTIMPHARGVARRDATHLKRGGVVPPKKKTVAFPVSPPANAAGGNSCLSMRRRLSPPGSRRQPVLPWSLRSARAQSTACAPWPQGDPPCAPGQRADALAEPLRQLAARLVAKPEPCELDHSRPCPRVSRPADAPIAIHTAALIGHWCDADVARDLPAVVE